MRRIFKIKQFIDNRQLGVSQEDQHDNGKLKAPSSLVVMYCIAGFVFVGVAILLAIDLISSHSSIITERSTLAVQTSGLLSQRFANTITAADYVLRDVTTEVTVEELNKASKNPEIQNQLSTFVREKLVTLPNAYGLGFLDKRCIFVAAADEKVIGIQSNSRLHAEPGQTLEKKTYAEYVPASKSANKQPAILVSRPILSTKGDFEGGALAAIMLTSAQKWIQDYQIGKYDTISMIDEQGILLAHNPPKLNSVGKRLQYGSDQSKLDVLSSNNSFIAVSPLDGRERIYGVSKIENIPIYIIVGFDKQQALGEWQRRLWQLSAGYITLLIMTVVMLRNQHDALVQREEMRKLSVTDPLTGIANRRQLMLSGETETLKALRYNCVMSVLMIDIDHFKRINDTWGHPVGDRVIKYLARSMRENLRNTDILGRVGGEEFVVVMPETDSVSAGVMANRLRKYIEMSVDNEIDAVEQIRFTVSIGVSSFQEGDATFEDVLGRADKALYNAKSQGRNRVSFSS